MTDTRDDRLPRREFLRHSACLIGAASLALGARPGQAAATQTGAEAAPALSLAFWDGARLIAADHLPSGDPILRRTGVRLVVRAMPAPASRRLHALDAHYLVSLDGAEAYVPFHAWAANPHGPARAAFTVPVVAGGTVRLSAHHGDAETWLTLTTGTSPALPKLRAGHYVLALGTPRWGAYLLQPDSARPLVRRTLGGFAPASLEYLLLSASPA